MGPGHGLFFILLLFLVLTSLYSLVTPLTQGEDELAHYRYLSFIAQTGRLPLNMAEREQAWYRSDWPALYHVLVGWAVSPLDTSQPHLKDVGESPRRRLVGEIFYPRLIIYTEDVSWPWQDGILAWHLGRFASILFSTAALVFVYRTAAEMGQAAARHRPLPLRLPAAGFALAATALLAFSPRFMFTSAMLGDDSLFILLSAIFIWLLLRALRGDDRWRVYAGLGLLLGLSISTKYSTGLFPLAIIPLVWWRRSQTGWRWPQALGRLLWSWLFVAVGAGWWFGWLAYHFNTIETDGFFFGLLSPVLAAGPDVSMRRVFAFFGGGEFSGPLRPGAVAAGNFGDWWVYLFQTFWGVPVLEHDPLFPWVYLPALAFCLAALVGLGRYWRQADTHTQMTLALLALLVLLLLPFPILRFFLTYNILETGQGRHILYPAAQAIPILLMLGWLAFGEKVGVQRSAFSVQHSDAESQNPSPKTRNSKFTTHHFLHGSRFTVYAFLPPLALLLWSCFQLAYMHAAYPEPLPVRTTTFDPASIPQPLRHQFTTDIQFLGYDFQPDPEQAIINLTLYWQALAQVDENYRVRVQLLDPTGQSRFTWLSHPLNGRYPTRAWDQGDVIRDRLPLPLAAVPANTYQIQLDLVREAELTSLTAEPLQIIQFDLGQTQPIANAEPFNQRLRYRLWLDADQPARQRQTIALSFQGSESSDQHSGFRSRWPGWALVGPDNVPRPPVVSGEAAGIFIVGGDWPSGDYHLSLPGGEATIRPVLRVANDVRLFDLPADITGRPGWTPVEANFAGQIELLGYDLPARRVEPGGGLPLAVAWRSLAPVLPDAVTFAVLLDADQQARGSVDRYPAGFYSPLLWVAGEIVPDNFTVPVRPDAPPGVYTVHLGQYVLVDGQPQSLPLLQNGQPTGSSAVLIGPVKVGGPPPAVVAESPGPQVVINQTLGQQITLLGYDIAVSNPSDNSKPETQHSALGTQNLKLTLYWQAESAPATDYTTFFHLRDANDQNVAQKDAPPAAGRYPTSLWEAGEVIVDEITLSLADVPPGDYRPVVGLYELASGARLPLANDPARTEIELQPVQVSE